MFKRKSDNNASSSRSFDSLIGSKTMFEGNINCEGSIRIDGKVNGDIKAHEDILISETAQVTGNIQGNNIHISGRVDGNVCSVTLLRLYSTAFLCGDIEAISFVTEEAAYFNGKCKMPESSHEQIPSDNSV